MKMKQYFAAALVAVATLSNGFTQSARAEDPDTMLDQAKELFAQRADLAKANEAVNLLKGAEAIATDADLKYDIQILLSRTYYWLGLHQSTKDSKKAMYDAGQKAADRAKQASDDFAEAYYFAGINLARWAEANGVLESLARKGELISYMQGAMDRVTRDGAPGESTDGYGPHRTLGRMFKKLPAVFGGSREKSLNHLNTAYSKAPTLAMNGLYLADTLKDRGSSSEVARAQEILTSLLAHKGNPAGLNPDRVPETTEELVLVEDLLNGKAIP
jgi:hypothetical protein